MGKERGEVGVGTKRGRVGGGGVRRWQDVHVVVEVGPTHAHEAGECLCVGYGRRA